MIDNLDEYQKQALDNAFKHEISYINGLPGCGKSFTVEVIANQLIEKGWKVSKLAPTGRASLRIGGMTIHKWLVPKVTEDSYGRILNIEFTKKIMSNKECLIIDESSMIEQELWNKVMEVYNNSITEKKIVFVGDENQLEPVKDGIPYMKSLKMFPHLTTTLRKIHRTAEGNDIPIAAHNYQNNINLKYDYKNVHIVDISFAIEQVVNDCTNNQIIVPSKKGEYGIDNINKFIQSELKSGRERLLTTKRWSDEEMKYVPYQRIYVGEKIVITKNLYNRDLTNGTLGVVIERTVIEEYDHNYKVWTNIEVIMCKNEYGTIFNVPVKFAERNIELAYAITVHKMQGSQVKNVFFVMSVEHQFMLTKRLIYTAMTRAVENLYIIKGEKDALR